LDLGGYRRPCVRTRLSFLLGKALVIFQDVVRTRTPRRRGQTVASATHEALQAELLQTKEALQANAKRKKSADSYVRYLPVVDGDDAPPTRRVVLAWRRSFTRYEAIAALRNAIYASDLPGVQRLT
jgi:hypothetical protein